MSKNTLARYEGDPRQRALSISNMPADELRREAMRAANERDAEALWALMETYLFLKGRKKGATSPGTLESYRLGLERLLKHWQGENLLRPSRDAGDRFVVELQMGMHGDRPLDPSTIMVRLAAARTLYKALRWAEATVAVPFDNTAAPPISTAPEERRTAYSEGDIEKLLDAAGPEDQVLILLGADGGLRAGEMLALRWEDVNETTKTLTVRRGKGAKRRTVDLSPDLLEALRAWKPDAPEERVLTFRSSGGARYRLQTLCDRTGVRYLAVHSLRHACGTWLYQQTGDLNVPRKHLGHEDISTTTVYAKMDRRALKEAVTRRRRPRSSPSDAASRSTD